MYDIIERLAILCRRNNVKIDKIDITIYPNNTIVQFDRKCGFALENNAPKEIIDKYINDIINLA